MDDFFAIAAHGRLRNKESIRNEIIDGFNARRNSHANPCNNDRRRFKRIGEKAITLTMTDHIDQNIDSVIPNPLFELWVGQFMNIDKTIGRI